MKHLYFVSSAGDTDLALKTIKALEKDSEHEAVIVALTKAAKDRAEKFSSKSLVTKTTLPEILQLSSGEYPSDALSEQQIEAIRKLAKDQHIDNVYMGIPSVSSNIPFQLAESIDMPLLMAYEFMFKPEKHSLWNYIERLSKKTNIHWAIPLASAKEDFPVIENRLHVTGHLSIDNAFTGVAERKDNSQDIRRELDVSTEHSLAFISSTTQAVEIDEGFLDCVLKELKNHPNMQVRLGLHPGIQNLDVYLQRILKITEKHPDVHNQFKIILHKDFIVKINSPELSITSSKYKNLFVRANIDGATASSAADRIGQAVPGALLNQAVLEGKPSYSHSGKPYLPAQYFSKSLNAFFSESPKTPRSKRDLGLSEESAPEAYARLLGG